MVCPYRKVTIDLETAGSKFKGTEENYAECYGTQCPYYWKSDDTGKEECERVTNEHLGRIRNDRN